MDVPTTRRIRTPLRLIIHVYAAVSVPVDCHCYNRESDRPQWRRDERHYRKRQALQQISYDNDVEMNCQQNFVAALYQPNLIAFRRHLDSVLKRWQFDRAAAQCHILNYSTFGLYNHEPCISSQAELCATIRT